MSGDAGAGGKARAHAAGDGSRARGAAGGGAKAGQKKAGYGGCLGSLVVIGALAWGVSYCTSNSDDTSDQIDEQVQQDDATSACHDWVKDKLKAPSSAKFSGDHVIGTGGDYTIAGEVDSQNSFGAMLRTTWTCTVKLDGDQWRGSADLAQS